MSLIPGIYGKLPGRGDFVTLRLPMRFVSVWDGWLQSAMPCSREQLGAAWLDRYLVSPPWRFLLSAGVCGPHAWAGVMIPSVDRVGRYFPLTLAAALSPGGMGLALTADRGAWFDAAEKALLYALSGDFSMTRFEAGLAALPEAVVGEEDHKSTPPASRLPRAWRVAAGNRPTDALALLCGRLLDAQYTACSVWWNAAARFDSGLLVSEGLPPVQAYASLLDGNWARADWHLLARAGQTGRDNTPGAPTEPASPVTGHSDPGVAAWPAVEPRSGEDVPPVEDARSGPPTLMDILNQKPHASAVPSFSPPSDPDPGPHPREFVASAEQAEYAFRSVATTHAGRVREHNEDALLDRADAGLWAIADGMGGHENGATASGRVVEACHDLLPGDGIDDLIEAVRHRLRRVDRELNDQARGAGITGSTVVALLANGDEGACLWAGDSRAYRLREGQLAQLTCDHSRVGRLLAEGRLASDEVARHPEAHVITRAVGGGDLVLDEARFPLREGDVFLLCSDGLNREVADPEIASVLSSAGSLESGVDRLLGAALDRGGRDNVSLIVVRVQSGSDC